MMLSFIGYVKISICQADFYFPPSKSLGPELTIDMYNKAISMITVKITIMNFFLLCIVHNTCIYVIIRQQLYCYID